MGLDTHNRDNKKNERFFVQLNKLTPLVVYQEVF